MVKEYEDNIVKRHTVSTEVEVWNFHNANEKVYLWLQNDGKIPTWQSIQTLDEKTDLLMFASWANVW